MFQSYNLFILTPFVVAQGYLTIHNPTLLRPSPLSLDYTPHYRTSSLLFAKKKEEDGNLQEEPSSSSSNSSSTKKKKKKNNPNTTSIKEEKANPSKSILSILSNPYQAGKSLRQTLDDAFTSLGPSSSSSSSSTASPLTSTSSERSIYYLDDRFIESSSSSSRSLPPGAIAFAQRSNQLFERIEKPVYIPEVLVIGATTALGRCIVQRLLLDGRFRVRVLVRDLYSRTLNMFGAGVTYCQGDLFDLETLEYALTDVDKIIFVEGAPRQDEENFREAFDAFVQETLSHDTTTTRDSLTDKNPTIDDEGKRIHNNMEDLEYRSQIIALRAKLAEQVDCIGVKNLIQAYHNVRHADYGTSQVAKRTLFKFKEGKDDFNLFALDWSGGTVDTTNSRGTVSQESPNFGRVSSQAMWIKNKFGHGVFTGRVKGSNIPGQDQGSSIISTRLRSRENPDKGIDLSNGFAGFIVRICSDGKKYQVFVRTGAYESEGIEYVCEFSTASKVPQEENKSINKFITVRLPFIRFLPRRIQSGNTASDSSDTIDYPPFRGSDVQSIGFRFRLESRNDKEDTLLSTIQRRRWTKFYLGISYIKAYRTQTDPEFFYLSDARLPPVLRKEMVRHDLHRIIFPTENDVSTSSSKILDEMELKRVTENPKDRSEEEIYFKFMGEEIIKSSGLCYAIARISELNELPSGEFSTVRLNQSGTELTPVSRAEVADVCVSALLDSKASNLCFYVSKAKAGIDPPVDILQVEKASKFNGLIGDLISQT